jgi:hypothetical protein
MIEKISAETHDDTNNELEIAAIRARALQAQKLAQGAFADALWEKMTPQILDDHAQRIADGKTTSTGYPPHIKPISRDAPRTI